LSARKDALTELRTRLEGITVVNGFTTNAGQQLFIGERPVLGPDDPAASIVMVVGTDQPAPNQGENVVYILPVKVQLLVRADVATPWDVIEDVIADVKKAVETDHDLAGTTVRRGLERGPTEALDRESGSEFVGVTMEYKLTMAEKWGTP
jgi:hypothetical protein